MVRCQTTFTLTMRSLTIDTITDKLSNYLCQLQHVVDPHTDTNRIPDERVLVDGLTKDSLKWNEHRTLARERDVEGERERERDVERERERERERDTQMYWPSTKSLSQHKHLTNNLHISISELPIIALSCTNRVHTPKNSFSACETSQNLSSSCKNRSLPSTCLQVGN